jgi:hypothetical protein
LSADKKLQTANAFSQMLLQRNGAWRPTLRKVHSTIDIHATLKDSVTWLMIKVQQR